MKRSKTHSLLAMLLVCVMALSLTACGGGGEEDSGALTKEEYEAAVEKLGEDFTDIQTEAANLDVTDKDASRDLLEDCKAPLEEFMDLVPPEVYAEGHEKLKSGCQGLIDYLDSAISILDETDPTKIAEIAQTMTDQLTTASEEMMEGAQILDEAAS